MNDVANSQIERALGGVVGAPLWGSARAADMEMFAFGEQRESVDRHGNASVRGEFALHVQCAWHLERNDELVVASRDLHEPSDQSRGGDSDHEPDSGNLRDSRIASFFQEVTPRVATVSAMWPGSISLMLDAGCVLRLFPDRTSDGVEHFRFFRPGTDEPHLIVTSSGVESA